MKKYLILLLAPLFSACTDEEMNSTLRAGRAALDSYNRPAYYPPQPVYQPVVQPVNPYYGY
jgi:hypothetical protein